MYLAISFYFLFSYLSETITVTMRCLLPQNTNIKVSDNVNNTINILEMVSSAVETAGDRCTENNTLLH